MPTFEKRTQMPVSAETLYEWHMRPEAFEALVPPWHDIRVVDRSGPLEEGARLVMKLYLGPVGIRWVAHHRDFVEGRQFVDEQLEGPFARWVHTHRFEPVGDETSELIDHVEYELPLGPLGRLVAGWKVERDLERMFEYRHEVTRRDVAEAG